MNIKAIIPTKKREDLKPQLVKYLKDACIEIIAPINKGSIFEAFQAGIKYVEEKDIVILCHNDIEIWTSHNKLKDWLVKTYKPSVGFLGVAGAVKMPKTGVWWQGLKEGKGERSGQVFHKGNKQPSIFGPYGTVETLDGVFLAIQGSKLLDLGVSKPSWLPKQCNWDFYDIDLSYRAHKKGLLNCTIPLQIQHDSPGIPRDSWETARKAFVSRFFN